MYVYIFKAKHFKIYVFLGNSLNILKGKLIKKPKSSRNYEDRPVVHTPVIIADKSTKNETLSATDNTKLLCIKKNDENFKRFSQVSEFKLLLNH